MRMRTLWAALLVAVPAFAAAQQPAAPSPFETMKANVARITRVAEKERWNDNVQLWTLALEQPGRISDADLQQMSALLDKIRANVATCRFADEKERWNANIAMWRAFIAAKGAPTKTDAAKLTSTFDTMKINVARITMADERERWLANRDLWQSVMDRSAAAF